MDGNSSVICAACFHVAGSVEDLEDHFESCPKRSLLSNGSSDEPTVINYANKKRKSPGNDEAFDQLLGQRSGQCRHCSFVGKNGDSLRAHVDKYHASKQKPTFGEYAKLQQCKSTYNPFAKLQRPPLATSPLQRPPLATSTPKTTAGNPPAKAKKCLYCPYVERDPSKSLLVHVARTHFAKCPHCSYTGIKLEEHIKKQHPNKLQMSKVARTKVDQVTQQGRQQQQHPYLSQQPKPHAQQPRLHPQQPRLQAEQPKLLPQQPKEHRRDYSSGDKFQVQQTGQYVCMDCSFVGTSNINLIAHMDKFHPQKPKQHPQQPKQQPQPAVEVEASSEDAVTCMDCFYEASSMAELEKHWEKCSNQVSPGPLDTAPTPAKVARTEVVQVPQQGRQQQKHPYLSQQPKPQTLPSKQHTKQPTTPQMAVVEKAPPPVVQIQGRSSIKCQ